MKKKLCDKMHTYTILIDFKHRFRFVFLKRFKKHRKINEFCSNFGEKTQKNVNFY